MDNVKWVGKDIISAGNKADRQFTKTIAVVDPQTGLSIPHATGVNFRTSEVEVISTTLSGSEPGMKMQVMDKGGDFKEVQQYTFVRIRDPQTGDVELLKTFSRGDFDIVNVFTGEILCESRIGQQLPARVLDPDKYWAAERQRIVGLDVPNKLSEVTVTSPDFDIELKLRPDVKSTPEG